MAPSLPNPYAAKGLPNPYAAVISAPPIMYSEEEKAARMQKKTPAFHNPHNIKRPQAKGTVVKKPAVKMPTPSSDPAPTAATSQQPGLDYWRSTAEDDAETLAYKTEMNRQEKKRKKERKDFINKYGHWQPTMSYKPNQHTNLAAYRASGAWRDVLNGFNDYVRAASRSTSKGDDSAILPAPSTLLSPPTKHIPMVAPPSLPSLPSEPERIPPPPPSPPPPPPAEMPPSPPSGPPPPPPIDNEPVGSASSQHNAPLSSPYSATISAPPVRYAGATISGPPVRYNVPTAQVQNNAPKPTRGERPAKRQKISKAEAMMAKMGYVKGQGLGKNSDGITTHLEVKARTGPSSRVDLEDDFMDDEKGKKIPIKSQQVFDITGGHRLKQKEPDRFGEGSKVVVAWGCLEGVDMTADADRDDGGIRQEMGQMFDAKFGSIERVYINMNSDQRTVYIKFNSELSALNAVNRFHEGYQFRGRNIRAQYYNEAKFEAFIFDH